MIDSPVRAINDVVAGFLSCGPSDKELLACHMPPDSQARLNLLLDLNSNDELSKHETQELHEYLRANGFISFLKAKVKRRQRLGAL